MRQVSTFRHICAVLAGGLLAGSIAASASSVSTFPSYSTAITCASGSGEVIEGSAPCAQSSGGASDSATFTTLPFASVSATSSVDGVLSSGATSVLNYVFEVIGGNAGDPVPLQISADLFTSIDGDAYAFSEIDVFDSSGDGIGGVTVCTGSDCPSNVATSFSSSFDVEASADSFYELHLEVVSSSNPVLGPASSMTSADPFITFAPGFANAADYSIVQSPGVGNGIPSTPEPDTLVLVGCGPLLLLARRYLGRRWSLTSIA